MTREIILHDGSVATVDDGDYTELSIHKWFRVGHTDPTSRTSYACRRVKTVAGWRVLLMHREILKPQKAQEIDHLNDDGLDNRRSNLRFSSSGQNKVSRPKRPSRTGFKGVHQNPKTPNRWSAVINIGTFDSPEEAAQFYDDITALLWGEYARPNFPIAPPARGDAQ